MMLDNSTKRENNESESKAESNATKRRATYLA